jgi:hypothetical protein
MKTIAAAAGVSALLWASFAIAQAPTGKVTPEYPKAGSPAAEPGATGPGSENNAVTSPDAPGVPASKQPAPDVPANSGSSSGASGTSGPTKPAPQGNDVD